MNPIFADDAPLAAPLRSLLARLCDTEVSHIVLAIADDDVVRQETMAEMGERLSGRYRLAEFDYADPPFPSLPRFYRQLAGDPPACVFAHGLDVLKMRETEQYEEALHFLNAHREDLFLAPGAVILWVTIEVWKDVQVEAPDFADWESASASFVLPPGQRVERTALGRLSIGEAEDLRRQVAGFKEMLSRPNLGTALEQEFKKQLDLAERRLGRVVDVRRDYLLYLVDELREHVLRRFAPQVSGRVLSLPLPKIFLPLRAVEGRPALAEYAAEDLRWQEAAGDFVDLDWRSRREEMEKRYARLRERQTAQRELSLKDLLKKRRAVLLGDPGTGKSTVCHYVAWALAAEDLTHIGDAVRGRLPVLVRLADVGKALEADSGLTLLDYVGSQLLPGKPFGACLRSAIEAGECMVILDGLDEVTDPDLRAEVTTQIQGMVATYGANRYLVTSRIVGYDRSPLTRDFRHATLKELEHADRKRFVKLWHTAIRAAIHDHSVVASEADLIETLEKKPQIARMAANPLLLTIMVLMHWRGIKLPNRRVQVYQIATDTLIEYWAAERVALDAEEVKQILAPVAHYILSCSVGGVIARRDLLPRLRDGLVSQRGCDVETVESLCDELLTLLGEQSGIFLERGLDAQGHPVYGFLHQTFGEYLAALKIASEVLDGSFEIESYIHRSAWHEPLLLLAGHLSLFSQAHASLLVRAILDYPCPYEETLRRNVLLAAECLADDVQVAPDLRDEVLRKLAELLFYPAPQPRQAALEVYRQLGRTRHRGSAAATVMTLHESWGEPERLDSEKKLTALAIATALVRLGARDASEPLLVKLEASEYEYRAAIRRLRLEGWPEKVESLLLQWKEIDDPFDVGTDVAGTDLRGVDAGAVQSLVGSEAFSRLLERILVDERSSKLERFKLRWLLAVASDPPSKEALLSLMTRETPTKFCVLAANHLLGTEHRAAALEILQEAVPYSIAAAEALFENGEVALVDWNVVRNTAFSSYQSELPSSIGLLLKAGKIEMALAAVYHLIATNWRAEYPWELNPFLTIIEILATEGQLEVAQAVSRWLALWPGYSHRLEACEALMSSGGVEEAINLVKFVAYECHGEPSQKASQRLLNLSEPELALPVLTQLAHTASPDLQYEASLALALAYRRSAPHADKSRIELKAMILDERQQAYRNALDTLYEIGMDGLGDLDSANPPLNAVKILGRLSLAWLCGRGSLREQTASLPSELGDASMMVGASLALFEWRGGHFEKAKARLRGLAAKHGFDTRVEVRPWLLRVLARAHGHEAASVLEGALRDPDPLIRVTAVESLSELIPESYTESLVKLLADSDEDIRSTAMLVSGRLRDPETTAILIDALRDGHASVRGSAAEALGRLGAKSAVPELIRAYSDEEEMVRQEVVAALIRIGEDSGAETVIRAVCDPELRVRQVAAGGLKKLRDPSMIPFLVTMLSNEDPGIRTAAAEALGSLGGPEATRALIGLLLDEDPIVARIAGTALAQIPDLDVTQILIEAMSSGEESFQREAALVLAWRGSPAGEGILRKVLNAQHGAKRVAAAEALGELRIPALVATLLTSAEDQDNRVRAAVVSALGRLDDPAARRAVVAKLKDDDAFVRCAALRALSEVPASPRTEVALEAFEDREASVRQWAVWVFGSDADPKSAAFRRLLLATEDKDPEVRYAAVQCLERCSDETVTSSLIQLLGGEDLNVRMQAARALKRLRTNAAAKPLMALLNDSEGVVRAQAVSALGLLADSRAYGGLLTSLRDRQGYVRRAAAEALGRLGCLESIEPLMATFVQILMTPERGVVFQDLPSDEVEALAAIAQALARLNASDALQFLVTYAIPKREYMKSLIPLDVASVLGVLDRFANPLSDESWPHWLRGHALWRLGRLSEARKSFRLAVAARDIDSLLSLSLFDLERNNLRGAIHHVDQALEKEPRRPISLLTQAVVQCRRGEIGKAQDNLEQARHQDPYVTDVQDLEFDHLWRAEALAALSELLGYSEKYETVATYSEVAEPRARYDPSTPD